MLPSQLRRGLIPQLGADLPDTDLDHADLLGADLRGAYLRGAWITETALLSYRRS